MNKIGQITNNELAMARKLYDYRLALENILKSLDDQPLEANQQVNLSTTINQDLEIACKKYEEWWNEHTVKYNWNYNKSQELRIDLQTGGVYESDQIT